MILGSHISKPEDTPRIADHRLCVEHSKPSARDDRFVACLVPDEDVPAKSVAVPPVRLVDQGLPVRRSVRGVEPPNTDSVRLLLPRFRLDAATCRRGACVRVPYQIRPVRRSRSRCGVW
jgi:hypothetical protein